MNKKIVIQTVFLSIVTIMIECLLLGSKLDEDRRIDNNTRHVYVAYET